jgi:hypothetical protein
MSENFFDYLPMVFTLLAYVGFPTLGIWLIAYPIDKAIKEARARSIRRTEASEIISFELNAIRRLYEHDLGTSLSEIRYPDNEGRPTA